MILNMHQENAALQQRISDLEAENAWLRGNGPNHEPVIAALRTKFAIKRGAAKLIIEMSDRKLKTHARLFDVCCLNDEAELKIVSIYVCHLRRAGFIIETIWGIGYRLSQTDAAEIKALIAQVQA